MVSVKVGGWDVRTIGKPGDVEWSSIADGGCEEGSVTLSGVPANFLPATTRRGVAFEIMEGPHPVFSGFMREPERGDGTVTLRADGWHREAERALALNTSSQRTSSGHMAITQAIARGALHFNYRGQLEFVDAFTADESTKDLVYIDALLDAIAAREGVRWGVGPDREFYWEADSTAPDYLLSPGSGVMGVADDEYASHLYGVRVSALDVDGNPSETAVETVSDPAAAEWLGRREFPVDLTPAGLMSDTAALADLGGRLALGKARGGYTNGLEPVWFQITTLGGTPAHLPFVQARQAARLHGVLNESGNLQFGAMHDFMIGRVRYKAGASSIAIDPVGLVPRNFADVTQEAATREKVVI